MTNTIENINISELLDKEVMQNLQDGFCALTGLSVLIFGANGKLLTKPGFGEKLCQWSKDASDRNSCIERIIQSVNSLPDTNSIQKAVCLAGMTIFAAPIMVENAKVATMLVCSGPCSCSDEVKPSAGKTRVRKKISASAEKTNLKKLESSTKLIQSLTGTLGKLFFRGYELRYRLKELTILHHLTSMLAGQADLNQILNITAREVVQVIEAKGCSIRIYNPETQELQIKAVANLSKSYLQKGSLKLADSQIDQSALSGEPVLIENMLTDPRVIYKKEAETEGIRSGLAVGMKYRGETVGVIHIYSQEERRYDHFELETLKAVASQAASAIINAQLYQESLDSERMQRQLKMAAEVQGQMLPRCSPNIPRIAIGSFFEPSYLVGGDFYDFPEFPDGRLGIVIADVAGKGIPASLRMSALRATIRAYISHVEGIEELILLLDKSFRRDSIEGEFATMILGLIDPKEGTLSYVSAGHNPALLVRDHLVEQMKASGPALAIFPDPKFPVQTIELKPEDRLILYTDGVTDAMNFDQQPFGLDRLIASTNRYSGLDPQKTADNILWDVRRFIGLATQSDDMTLMVVKYNP